MIAAVYFTDSVGLLGATYILIKTLNDNFSGTTFQNETLILKVVFFIFTVGYVGQSIMFIFLSGITSLNLSATSLAVTKRRNVSLFFQLFLDIFPILSLVYIHHRNLGTKEKRHGSSLASVSSKSKRSVNRT